MKVQRSELMTTEPLNRKAAHTEPLNLQKFTNLMCAGPCIIAITEKLEPTRCHLLFYCTSYRLNMFRALLCPSSGAHDYNVDYHIGRFVL